MSSDIEGLWTLTSIGGEAPLVTTTLLISGDKFQGGGYCHDYSAAYTFDGTRLSVGPVSTQEVGCVRLPTPQEPLYFESIGDAHTASVQGNELTIRAPKTTLVYLRRADPGPW